MNIRIMGTIAAATIACLLSERAMCVEHKPALILVDSSISQYSVVISDDASMAERHAANELTDFIRQMTGAKLPLLSSALWKHTPAIAVGPGAVSIVAPTVDLSFKLLKDDGIVIKTEGDNLLLTGATGSKRGTLYAVYEFLEMQGVRFFTVKDTFVPKINTLTISPIDKVYTPQIQFREAFYRAISGASKKGEDNIRFAVRMRNNGHATSVPQSWGGSEPILGWCHTFSQILPPSKYFETHPEWFSEVGGKRTCESAFSQLCLTNEEMTQEFIKQVLIKLDAHPDTRIISISQNDGLGNCECATCRALDTQEGSPAGSLLAFVNKVAEAVEEKHPDVFVSTLAYLFSTEPPKHIRARHNVIIRYCLIGRTMSQPITGSLNSSYMQNLTAWQDKCDHIYLWDYVANYSGPFTPHPSVFSHAADIHTYALNKTIGVFAHGNVYCDVGYMDDLNIYVISHLLWDPSRNGDELIREFLTGYYGAAAPMIESYLKIMSERASSEKLGCAAGMDAMWLDLNTINKATDVLARAKEAVAGDDVALSRLKKVQMPIDHQWLRGYYRYRDEAEQTQSQFLGPKDPIAAVKEFIAYGKSLGLTSLVEGTLTFEQYATILEAYAHDAFNPEKIVVPAEFKRIPEGGMFDYQEDKLKVYPGGAYSKDKDASNGYAVFFDPKIAEMQVRLFKLLDSDLKSGKKWRIYASVKIDATADKGVAFTSGFRNWAGKMVFNSHRIEDVGMQDGKYHLVDCGLMDLDPSLWLWFGTTGAQFGSREGGVDPEIVKGVWLDRVIIVRESQTLDDIVSNYKVDI